MMKDFYLAPLDEQLRGALAACLSLDKPMPTVQQLAKLTGIPADEVREWLKAQGVELSDS